MKHDVVDFVVDDELVGQIYIVTDPSAPGLAEVHNTMFKWSVSICKKLMVFWEALLVELKEKGINKVISSSPIDASDKVIKYWFMFGLTNLQSAQLHGQDYWFAERSL